MPKTLTEIQEQLTQLDEISLLELLKITSEDLVSRFADIIEERADDLERELEQWFPSSDDSGDSN